VISTAGIGDLDALFARASVGVILRGFTEADYVAALQALDEMRAVPELRAQCRRVAVTWAERGIAACISGCWACQRPHLWLSIRLLLLNV
jgi:hypothetical protein